MDTDFEKVATFHNHYGAMVFKKKVEGSRLAPVPRSLSSSCGTAAFFSSPFKEDYVNENLEAVYIKNGESYRLIYESKE